MRDMRLASAAARYSPGAAQDRDTPAGAAEIWRRKTILMNLREMKLAVAAAKKLPKPPEPKVDAYTLHHREESLAATRKMRSRQKGAK